VEWAGFWEKPQGASNRKARDKSPGLPLEAGKEIQLMILLLVKLRSYFFGRLTALIVWTRKSRR
jgi:hypothetical protein